jgi:hypothetical protein
MTVSFIALTAVVLLAAVIALTLALRVIARERQRSEARVAHLAGRLHDTRTTDANDGMAVPVHTLFVQPADRPRSLWLALTVAVGATVLVVVVLRALSAGAGSNSPTPVDFSAPKDTPLELIALRDERSAEGLTIHGVVRNPSRGYEVDHVVAVVLVFNDQGGFLTSGRAAIDTPALPPGGEALFAVTIPDAAAVGRYRVSFRDDSRVLPHVDRRQT